MDLKHTLLLILTSLVFLHVSAQTDAERLRKAYQMPEDTNKVLALSELGFEYSRTNHDTARMITSMMKKISRGIGYAAGVATAMDIEGNILRGEGKYNDAIDLHLEALRIFDSVQYTDGYIPCLVNTGTDYVSLHNYDKALDCYNKALQILPPGQHRRFLTIINNIGIIYNNQGKYEKAIEAFKKALPYTGYDSTLYNQASLYSNMGISYLGLGEYPKAIQFMKKARHLQQVSGSLNHFAGTSNSLASVYISTGNYKEARKMLNEGYEAALKVNARSVIANYYRNMAFLSAKTGRYDEAYGWEEKFISLNDSLISESHVAQLAETETRYNVDKQKQELALIRSENSLKQSELNQGRLWRYVFVITLIALLLVLLMLYRNMQLKKKANKALARKNEALEAENMMAQFETLRSQINPHFLFNCLNALSSLIHSDTQRASEFVGVFSRLYRNVLEQKHNTVITLAEELQLAEDYIYLQKIRFGDSLVVERYIEAGRTGMFIPPFCVQMLLENAIKHNIIDDDRPLHIVIRTHDNYLQVTNNLQQRSNMQHSTGVGIRNMIARYRMLHDELPTFEMTNDSYIARIPLIQPV